MSNLIVMLDIKIKYAKSHPEHAERYFEQVFVKDSPFTKY